MLFWVEAQVKLLCNLKYLPKWEFCREFWQSLLRTTSTWTLFKTPLWRPTGPRFNNTQAINYGLDRIGSWSIPSTKLDMQELTRQSIVAPSGDDALGNLRFGFWRKTDWSNMSLSCRCGCCQHQNGGVVKEGTFSKIGMAYDGRYGNFIMRKRFISYADVLFPKSDNQVRRNSSV